MCDSVKRSKSLREMSRLVLSLEDVWTEKASIVEKWVVKESEDENNKVKIKIDVNVRLLRLRLRLKRNLHL